MKVLRQPIEDKKVTISRANQSISYPCSFLLVSAMNPCPCGFYGTDSKECSCSPLQIRNYLKKISGPILDRFDLILEVPRLKKKDILEETSDSSNPYTTEKMAASVKAAQSNQKKRNLSQIYNGFMTPQETKNYCKLDDSSKQFLAEALENRFLTGRTYDKIIKVARTIADIESTESITMTHLLEAMQYRRSSLMPDNF